MFRCLKTNKVCPDNKYINDTSELGIIYKIINICYDSLNAVEGIWQGNRLVTFNNNTYYIIYSVYNRIIGITIEKLNFLKQIENEMYPPIEYFNLDNYQLNINNLSKYICVECNLYHADCKYKNCSHYVNHDCAIIALNKNNKCNHCLQDINKKKIEFITVNDKDTCPICLEDTYTVLKDCNHYFHESCLLEHLKNNTECPICRRNISGVNKEIKNFQNIKYSIGNNREGIVDVTFINYN